LDSENEMTLGPYDTCYCGSGAKFRFCCFRITKKVEEIMDCFEEQKYDDAMKIIDKLNPAAGSAEGHGLRALALGLMDRIEDAEEELRLAFEVNPNYSRGFHIKASFLMDQDQYEEAVVNLDRALEIYPENCVEFRANALLTKGHCFFEISEFEAAKQAWMLACEALPDMPIVQGTILRNIYNNPEVPESMKQKDAFYYKYLAHVPPEVADEADFFEDGDGDAADLDDLDEETLQEIIELMKKAEKAHSRGNVEKAIEHLEESLDLYPENQDALAMLHACYSEIGDIDEPSAAWSNSPPWPKTRNIFSVAATGLTLFDLYEEIGDELPHFMETDDNGESPIFYSTRIPWPTAKRRSPCSTRRRRCWKNNSTAACISSFSQQKKNRNPKDNKLSFSVRIDPEKNILYMETHFQG